MFNSRVPQDCGRCPARSKHRTQLTCNQRANIRHSHRSVPGVHEVRFSLRDLGRKSAGAFSFDRTRLFLRPATKAFGAFTADAPDRLGLCTLSAIR